MSDPKTRIISHMNKDHHLAVVDYVAVYSTDGLSKISPDSVRISDVSDKVLSITYTTSEGSTKQLDLPWDEIVEEEKIEVTSLKDVKAKLIAMAKYAAKKQGYSHIQVKKIAWPTTAMELFMYVFAASLLVVVIDKTIPRQIAQALDYKVTGSLSTVINFLETYGEKLFVTIYSIHLFEVFFVLLPKLNKYRVPLRTKAIWMAFNFVEGFFAILRFNKLTQ